MRLIFTKFKRFLFVFLTGFISFIVLLLFHLSITTFVFFTRFFHLNFFLLRRVTFQLSSLAVTLIVLLFWIYSYLLIPVSAVQQYFLHWEILIKLLSHFPQTFLQTQKELPPFIAQLMPILVLIGTVFVNLRDVPQNVIVKLDTSAAATEFSEQVQLGIDVYVSHRKYQDKFHSSSWFSVAYAAAIAHRNNFFCLYQQNKSAGKAEFKQVSYCCKRNFEAAKLAYANKTKESITSQKLVSHNLSE